MPVACAPGLDFPPLADSSPSLGHCGLTSACPSLSCFHRAPLDTLTAYLLVLYRVSLGGCIRNTSGSREGMVPGKQAGKVSLYLLWYILDFDHVNG